MPAAGEWASGVGVFQTRGHDSNLVIQHSQLPLEHSAFLKTQNSRAIAIASFAEARIPISHLQSSPKLPLHKPCRRKDGPPYTSTSDAIFSCFTQVCLPGACNAVRTPKIAIQERNELSRLSSTNLAHAMQCVPCLVMRTLHQLHDNVMK